jgi:dTDP-4-amino-4,6-dideoxygalactose transaminase
MGASCNDKRSGSLADIGCTSFYPAKPLSGIGDGGMVFTNDPERAKTIRSMANHGRIGTKRYSAEVVGGNSRLDTIQAAVLLERFKYFESDELPFRNQQAMGYFDKLGPGPNIGGKIDYEIPWSWYPVLYDTKIERDEAFQEFGGYAGARIIYPEPLHLMPAFKHYGHKRGDFPVAESVCERIIAFPIVHHWEVNRCLCTMSSAPSAATALR